MIAVKREGILLEKSNFDFENGGVLNPAAIRENDSVHLFYRAVKKGNHSTIGYARLDGPLTVAERSDKPVIIPEFDYESQGVEDARIVNIEGLYYMTYTGYDGINARGVLATSEDLRHFSKQGLIVPPISYAEFAFLVESAGVNDYYSHNHKFYYRDQNPDKKIMLWDKNVVFFPRKIDGKLVFFHRIRPGIQMVSINNMQELTKEFWEDYFVHLDKYIVMDPVKDHAHESAYIGSGCPPIETGPGWLLIYHGVEKTSRGLVYSACAALLDLENPAKVLARLPYALFSPKLEWELHGEVNDVVFPTGTAVFGNTLFIYYGAADSAIACASVNVISLVEELLKYSLKKPARQK